MLGERSLTAPFLAAFRQGLRELGYTEGQSIVIEERYTHEVLDRVPTLAVELLRLKVDVLVVGGTVAAQAAKALTTMVPIVFTLPGDPVGSGLVAGRARPSGNATELSTSVSGLSGKQLEFLVLEYRAAAGHYERFPALAAELVQLKPDVIVTQGLPAALATKDATTTVPIVMVGVGNPVGSGLVASLARPGGNITGLSTLSPELVGKQLEFLKDVLPTVSRVAVLWNPANPARALQVRAADVAAQQLGVQMHLVEARGADAFDSAFAAMTSAHTGALLVLVDNIFFEHRRRLAELAAMSHLPIIHQNRALVEAGGLISYAVSPPDGWRHGATDVDKILKGAKPADLPVEQLTKFELVINLKTAKTLGLTIPPTVLFQANEVIR